MADQNNKLAAQLDLLISVYEQGGITTDTFREKVIGIAAPAVPAVDALTDARWLPNEQAAFSAWAITEFPNESSQGLISLGSAWKQGQAYSLATPSTVAAEQALRNLCDQFDSMKRRLRHTPGTGQNHSYLLHEDVEAYVEDARKALATPSTAPADPEQAAPRKKWNANTLVERLYNDTPTASLSVEAGALIQELHAELIAARQSMKAIQAAPEATSEQMGGAQVAKETERPNLQSKQIFEVAAPHFAWNADSWRKATQGTIGMPGLLEYTKAAILADRAAVGEATELKPLTDTTHTAMLSACDELPEGYSIRIELEKGAGWVELHLPDGTSTHIEGEGYLSQDIIDALDVAIEQHGGGK